jgi:hypothetical protein
LQLLPWLQHYNCTRPHGSLGHAPPISRVFPLVQRLDKPQLAHSNGCEVCGFSRRTSYGLSRVS